MKIYHKKGKKSMNEVRFEKMGNSDSYKLYINGKCKGAYLTIDEVLSIIGAEDERCSDHISKS